MFVAIALAIYRLKLKTHCGRAKPQKKVVMKL
jgi:hypothetical protein